ncbi:Manganese transport system ATP-binding protein [Chlamydia trachomatis]|nr:Manganese transport system ATP-binding protein [Chlamydia trachomatis]
MLTGKYKSSILYREYGQAELDQSRQILLTIQAGHLIDRRYNSLSQGEQQLLLIVRSLMEKPQILILDEATVGLDLLARERLLKHIDRICQLKNAPAIIYVTHHAEEITAPFSHVLLLKEGKVLAQGPKEEILTPELLGDFYGNQVELIPLGNQRIFIKPLL